MWKTSCTSAVLIFVMRQYDFGETVSAPCSPPKSARSGVDHMHAYTHWRWHLDEVFVKINGEMYYLWRAVHHEGEVLESFASKTKDKAAALKFIKQAMKRHGKPKAIVADYLRS
jgi:transposase-like protein